MNTEPGFPSAKKVTISEPEMKGHESVKHKRSSIHEDEEPLVKFQRIVDVDRYDYSNLGYEWEIINGYIGGENTNKIMSYEQILAKSQDQRKLPFEEKKKEKLFNVQSCLKLERDKS
mmetsp:Transcript_34057/g.33248  ORF Transcript_34057/g.33248 Transcript_34057/m.33248 type:complete len:117 (-) Transcript_34057:2717-3067(-)